jgi:hypothetical protein
VEALSLWVPLCLLGAYLYLELMRGSSELAPRLGEASYDVAIYRRAGEAILAGKVHYRDFFIEYPPGSLPVFVPPALFSSSREGYASLFASEMAFVLVAALLLTACADRSLSRPWPLFPVAVFAAGAILLYPVAVTRYDAVVALTLAATVALTSNQAFGRNSAAGAAASVAAWVSLGFGAAAKLVPALVTLPLALLAGRGGTDVGCRSPEHRARVRRILRRGGGVLVTGLAVRGQRFFDELLVPRGPGVAARESGGLGVAETRVRGEGLSGVRRLRRAGAGRESSQLHELAGDGSPVGAYGGGGLSRASRRQVRAGALPRFAAAFVLAFLIGSKVLSPQYVIWLLPLVPLNAGGVWGLGVSTVFLAVCWMTTQIFPFHYLEISAGRSPGTDILLGRNFLLLVLWGLMLSLPSGSQSTGPSKRAVPERGSPA